MDYSIIYAIVFMLIVVAAVVFGNMYYSRTYLPRQRIQALEASMTKAAEINARKERSEMLSISDVLDRNSPENSISGLQRLLKHPFHEGPFADELSDEEWDHVHQFYPKAIEEAVSHVVKTNANMRQIQGSEERMTKLTQSYKKAADDIAAGTDPYAQQWEELESDPAVGDGTDSSGSNGNTPGAQQRADDAPRQLESPREYANLWFKDKEKHIDETKRYIENLLNNNHKEKHHE